MKKILFPAILLFTSCARDAIDPMRLSPETPFASWTPREGNKLISSKHCKTYLPESFGESTLNLAELIDIALMNSPKTKKSWAEARIAAAKLGKAASAFFPDVTLHASYTRQKGSFPVTGTSPAITSPSAIQSHTTTTKQFYSTQAGPDLTLTYTLFDFGQRSSAAIAAREALYYADLNHNQEIQVVIQSVMDSYYSYLYELSDLGAKEANVQNAKLSLDAANERFSLGLAALGDVTMARTQFLQTRINRTNQKQAVESAFASLAIDLGLPANIPFEVTPLPETISLDPVLESVDQLISIAQNQRQDFLALEADIRSKEAEILNAKRAPLPTISATLDTGHYWLQKKMQEKDFHLLGTVSLNMPLFDGFLLKNKLREAESSLEKAKAALYQKELSIIQDVTVSHMNVKTSASNLSDTDEYLASAELEFNIAIHNYKAGRRPFSMFSLHKALLQMLDRKELRQRRIGFPLLQGLLLQQDHYAQPFQTTLFVPIIHRFKPPFLS